MTCYVIFRGPLGFGKSRLAERFARAVNGEYVSIDKVLEKDDLIRGKEAGYIRANEIVAPRAQSLLIQGTPVIFDGKFYWKSQLDDLISRLDFPHYVFNLKASLDLER